MIAAVQYATEVGAYAANTTSVTVTFTEPDWKAMAAECLAEAKAWREIAKRVVITPSSSHAYLCDEAIELPDNTVDRCRAMKARIKAHIGDRFAAYESESGNDDPDMLDAGEQRNARCLAALFLALECEDEAKALSRRGLSR